jgi:hypothetical protein
MRVAVIHRAAGARPCKPLVVRGGLVRTFGGLAGFLVLTFLGSGIYILEDAFANPLGVGDTAVIGGAFIITLAAVLLFFLIRPGKMPGMIGQTRAFHSGVPVVPHFFGPPGGDIPQGNLRNNLAYQRFYVDHSRIRP